MGETMKNDKEIQMDVVQEFNAALSQLYEARLPISRTKITQIAEISVSIAGVRMYKHLVQSVERFIHKCRPEYKLPGLYVIDAIIRKSRHQFCKEKDVFGPRFCQNLIPTFKNLFLTCQSDDKSKIIRVLNLWQKNGVYQPDVIQPLLDLANPNANLELLKSDSKKFNNCAPQIDLEDSNSYNDYPNLLERSLSDDDLINDNSQRKDVDVQSPDKKLDESPLDEFNYHNLQQEAINRFLEDGNQNSTPTEAEPPYPLMPSVSLKPLGNKTDVLIPGITDDAGVAQNRLFKLDRNIKSKEFIGKNDVTLITSPVVEQSKMLRSPEMTPLSPLPFSSLSKNPSQFMANNGDFDSFERSFYSDPPNAYAIQAAREASKPVFQTRSPLEPMWETSNKNSEIPGFSEVPFNSESAQYENDLNYHGRQRQQNTHKHNNDVYKAEPKQEEEDFGFPIQGDKPLTKEEMEEMRLNAIRQEQGLPPKRYGRACLCTKTLWIRNLSKNTTEEQVREALAGIGKIMFAKVVTYSLSAYVGMDTRLHAYKIYRKIKDNPNFLGEKIKVEWAPGKAIKDSWCREFWEADTGCSYIPYEMVRVVDLDLLEDGCVLDIDTLPVNLREVLQEKRAKPKPIEQVPLTRENLVDLELAESDGSEDICQSRTLKYIAEQMNYEHKLPNKNEPIDMEIDPEDNDAPPVLQDGNNSLILSDQSTPSPGSVSVFDKPVFATDDAIYNYEDVTLQQTYIPPSLGHSSSLNKTDDTKEFENSPDMEENKAYQPLVDGNGAKLNDLEINNQLKQNEDNPTRFQLVIQHSIDLKPMPQKALLPSPVKPSQNKPLLPMPTTLIKDDPFAPSLYELKTFACPPVKDNHHIPHQPKYFQNEIHNSHYPLNQAVPPHHSYNRNYNREAPYFPPTDRFRPPSRPPRINHFPERNPRSRLPPPRSGRNNRSERRANRASRWDNNNVDPNQTGRHQKKPKPEYDQNRRNGGWNGNRNSDKYTKKRFEKKSNHHNDRYDSEMTNGSDLRECVVSSTTNNDDEFA